MFTFNPWLLVGERHAGDETIILSKEFEKEEKFRNIWGLPKAEYVLNEPKRNPEYWRDFLRYGGFLEFRVDVCGDSRVEQEVALMTLY